MGTFQYFAVIVPRKGPLGCDFVSGCLAGEVGQDRNGGNG